MEDRNSNHTPPNAPESRSPSDAGADGLDVGGITVEPITVQIESILPEDDGTIVYSHAGPAHPGEPGMGIIAIRTWIRNTSSFAIRLILVRADILSVDNNGLLQVTGSVSFATSEIGSNDVTKVFDQTDPDDAELSAGQLNDFAIQKIKKGASQNIFFEEGTAEQLRLTFRFAAGPMQRDVVVIRPVAPAVNDNGTGTGAYLYPMKASDLRPNEYWAGASGTNNSHHTGNQRFAYDAGSRHVDVSQKTNSNKWPGADGSLNLDYRYFARPVYAMADGVVENIVRDKVDNRPGCKTDVGGSNHVQVRHGNEIASYLHLMRWSIDPALQTGSAVRAGQYLGLGGNSGNTGAPHLHVHVVDAATRTLRPLHFRNVHTQAIVDDNTEVASENWVKLDGNALPAESGSGADTFAIWPSRERPREVERGVDSGNGGAEVADLHPVALGPDVVVTAARMSDGDRLRLFSYGVTGSQISLQADSGNQAGAVQDLAAAEVSPGLIAVATRTASGNHKIIAWERSSNGTLTRGPDSGNQADAADLPRAVSLGDGRLITGLRTASGREKLIAWDVTADAITRLGETPVSQDDIDRLALSAAGQFNVVSCARRASSGKFQLRLWHWSEDGSEVELVAGSGQTGWSVEEVSVLGLESDLVVTATNDKDCNRLTLTAWAVEGGALQPIGDAGSQGDKIEAQEVVSLTDLGNRCFAVGLVASDGTARVSIWCVDSDYGSITLLGDSGSQLHQAGIVSVVATAPDRIVCALTTDSGKQKLIEFTH